MRIGEPQDVIGIHVTPSDRLSRTELEEVLDGADVQTLLQANEFVEGILEGRSSDDCRTIADICNVTMNEVVLGDLGVFFRRLPLTSDDESLFISPRDMADKFLTAVTMFVTSRDAPKPERSEQAAAVVA